MWNGVYSSFESFDINSFWYSFLLFSYFYVYLFASLSNEMPAAVPWFMFLQFTFSSSNSLYHSGASADLDPLLAIVTSTTDPMRSFRETMYENRPQRPSHQLSLIRNFTSKKRRSQFPEVSCVARNPFDLRSRENLIAATAPIQQCNQALEKRTREFWGSESSDRVVLMAVSVFDSCF